MQLLHVSSTVGLSISAMNKLPQITHVLEMLYLKLVERTAGFVYGVAEVLVEGRSLIYLSLGIAI